MKKLQKLMAAVLTAGMLLAGCSGGSSDEGEGASTGTPRDEFKVAANREPVSLDPTDVTVTYATLIEAQIYNKLLKYDNELNVVGDLAEEWGVADDGVTWTFKLRQGVKFHNGEELTSKDVLFTFLRLYDAPAAAISVAYIDKEGFETPDDYTFVLKTTVPYAFLEAELCGGNMCIMNEKAVTELGADYGRNPVGTGPYKFVSWTAGDNITVERFDDYFGEPAVTKTIVFKMITENSSRTVNLESGDVDLVIDIQESDVDRVAEGEETMLVTGSTGAVRYIGLNCRHEMFLDKRVRQAMCYATNIDEIRGAVYPHATPAQVTPVPPGFVGRNEGLAGYPYDPEKAKELLKEAGVEDGFTVQYIYLAGAANDQTAQLLQKQWEKVGVTLVLNPMESGALSTAMNKGEQDACCAGSNMSSFEAGKGLYDFFYSGSIGNTSNRTYLDDPEVDALLEQISTETDSAKRAELVYKAQELIMEDAPMAVICHTNAYVGMRKTVHGFEFVPTQTYDLSKVWFEAE
ncbi:MAG: ABC transporter substrate-binding protein [Solobacterium sp.]|nr:ABC transporter substrate-binding protein [Solobacterium sp.]